MTKRVAVGYEVDYYLDKDIKDELDIHENDSDSNIINGTFHFFTDYYKTHDEDGYHPPKYLSLDGIIEEETKDALKRNNLIGWNVSEINCTDDFEMETVYVFSKEPEGIIDSNTLRNHKQTRFSVNVEKFEYKK